MVLTRKVHEYIEIGASIKVHVVRIKGGQVRLGIEAPKQVPINRPDRRKKERHV